MKKQCLYIYFILQVGTLVSLAKSINYLAKKKQDYENKILSIKADIRKIRIERDQLNREFDVDEFQSSE